MEGVRKLIIALPSKGALKAHVAELFEQAGMALRNNDERFYRGALAGLAGVEVEYSSGAEIVKRLKTGRAHLGIVGEDLIRETFPDVDGVVEFMHPLGFGRGEVVVAVPDCWLDVNSMFDLEDVAAQFVRAHARHMRVATKYRNLTRRFFSSRGVASYRIVESIGTTEATLAAGTAELIVDFITTGTTLSAYHLKILTDGVILMSQAHLLASRQAAWNPETLRLSDAILARIEPSPYIVQPDE